MRSKEITSQMIQANIRMPEVEPCKRLCSFLFQLMAEGNQDETGQVTHSMSRSCWDAENYLHPDANASLEEDHYGDDE